MRYYKDLTSVCTMYLLRWVSQIHRSERAPWRRRQRGAQPSLLPRICSLQLKGEKDEWQPSPPGWQR